MTDTDEALQIIKTYEWACWSELKHDNVCPACQRTKEEGHGGDCRIAKYIKSQILQPPVYL